jgi:hypothetical protein
MGFPRSGTTAAAEAVCSVPRFFGADAEGHFLYLFAPAIERILTGRVNPASLFKKPDVRERFGDQMRAFFDQAIRLHYDRGDGVYVDKTPDIGQVNVIPALLHLYPDASIVFCFRDPVDCVESNMRTWPGLLNDPMQVATRWIALMEKWRSLRPRLSTRRFAEIYQGDFVGRAGLIAQQIAGCIGLDSAETAEVGKFLSTKIVNTRRAGPKLPALTENQKADVASATKSEWKHWSAHVRRGSAAPR